MKPGRFSTSQPISQSTIINDYSTAHFLILPTLLRHWGRESWGRGEGEEVSEGKRILKGGGGGGSLGGEKGERERGGEGQRRKCCRQELISLLPTSRG